MMNSEQEVPIQSVSVDIPDGVTQSITKIEDYLKKMIMWGRIILVGFLALVVVAILIYNFLPLLIRTSFPPSSINF